MKRLALALGVLAAGCAGTVVPSKPTDPREAEQQQQIREAFERWNAATAAGDVEASYRGMSVGLKSQWLWERMRDKEDKVTQAHLARLEPKMRQWLNRWFEAHEAHRPDRAEPLPEDIASSKWLFELYKEIFTNSRDFAMAQAKARRVTEVYILDGVTVKTDLAGNVELYVMVYEGDGWRVDGVVAARKRRP